MDIYPRKVWRSGLVLGCLSLSFGKARIVQCEAFLPSLVFCLRLDGHMGGWDTGLDWMDGFVYLFVL